MVEVKYLTFSSNELCMKLNARKLEVLILSLHLWISWLPMAVPLHFICCYTLSVALHVSFHYFRDTEIEYFNPLS